MRRILLRLAYDGTAYHGWQRQDNGISIQEKLEDALYEALGEHIEAEGGSRTDAGVHARDNVAAISLSDELRIPAGKLPYALNRRLPMDIRVNSGCEVAPDFHPRYCASIKTYEYRIVNSRIEDPLRLRYALSVHRELDAKAMAEAATALTGEHDFTSFCSPHAQSSTRVRRIDTLDVKHCEDELRIRVSGNGFLYNMVRIIAGTLMEVGFGKWDASAVERILLAKDRALAGPTAPPQGLCLMEYRFV